MLHPSETAVLVAHYESRLQTAIATWPRNAVTEKRLGQLQARLAELLAADPGLDALPSPSALVSPGRGIVVPGA